MPPRWPADSIEDLPVDRRNLIDHFKYWSDEAIRAELDTKRLPYSLLLENYCYDFNISTTIRNANAFLADEIHICGRKKWDKRGAVGTHHYARLHYHEHSVPIIESFRTRGFEIVAIDNVEGAIPLPQFIWNPKTLMIFGQEQIGISPEALDKSDWTVYIPQLGSVRSLNVGVASGIAMYDYVSEKNASRF